MYTSGIAPAHRPGACPPAPPTATRSSDDHVAPRTHPRATIPHHPVAGPPPVRAGARLLDHAREFQPRHLGFARRRRVETAALQQVRAVHPGGAHSHHDLALGRSRVGDGSEPEDFRPAEFGNEDGAHRSNIRSGVRRARRAGYTIQPHENAPSTSTAPVIFFDLETTGLSLSRDRIVGARRAAPVSAGRCLRAGAALQPGDPHSRGGGGGGGRGRSRHHRRGGGRRAPVSQDREVARRAAGPVRPGGLQHPRLRPAHPAGGVPARRRDLRGRGPPPDRHEGDLPPRGTPATSPRRRASTWAATTRTRTRRWGTSAPPRRS